MLSREKRDRRGERERERGERERERESVREIRKQIDNNVMIATRKSKIDHRPRLSRNSSIDEALD